MTEQEIIALEQPQQEPKPKKHGSLRRRRIISNTAIYIVLVLMSIIWLIPFVCIVLQSFRVGPSTGITNYLFASYDGNYVTQWGFDNYIKLFTENIRDFTYFGITIQMPEFVGWYLNTLLISILTAVIQTIMVLTMSYTLSRLRFKSRKFLMKFMLVLGMFPGFLTMIVLYRLLADMGLTQKGALFGLVLVYSASSGMGYYISKGFFDTISKSLDEAARIDGATRLQVLTKIILPLSKPIVIYTVLTAFMGPWGDFMFAKFIAFGENTGFNVAVGLQYFLSDDLIGKSYTLFCAGGVLVAIPVTLLFMFMQKYYVEGVTGGAVKG